MPPILPQISLCHLRDLCASVVSLFPTAVHHKDTKNTKEAQRKSQVATPFLLLTLGVAILLAGFNWRAISKPENELGPTPPAKQLPKSVPAWLGNAERNFYGTAR